MSPLAIAAVVVFVVWCVLALLWLGLARAAARGDALMDYERREHERLEQEGEDR